MKTAMARKRYFMTFISVLTICLSLNGVLGQVKQFDIECKPIDLVFVVDSSGSINDHHTGNYKLVKTFLKSLTAQLNIGPHPNQSHVAVVIYSKTPSVVFGLDQGNDPATVNKTIDNMVYMRSSTNIAGGVEMARKEVFGKNGDRADVMDIMVVITDGMATVRQNETLKEAIRAKDQKIHMITIGLTNKVDEAQLKAMSSNNELLMINSFQELNMAIYRNTIINATCFKPVRKVLDPVGVCEFANVVFVIDGSGSINDNDKQTFQKAMQHSLDVIRAVAIGSTGVFASIVTFNEVAEVNLDLSQRFGIDSVTAQISSLKFKGGRTNIAEGLKVATEHIMTVTKERQEFAHNFIVIISDGHSTMNGKEVIPAAEKAKEYGIYILASSVTSQVNKEVLRRVSSNYTVYDATLPDSAQLTVNKIMEITCTPRALACEQLDIVFLLDSSGSINDDNATNFDTVKTFVKDVASSMRLGPYHNQIGVVSFSDYARYEFFLREGQTLEEVHRRVNNIRYIGGTSNVLSGMKSAIEEVYGDPVNGNRRGARNILVVVSDGHADIIDEDITEQVLEAAYKGIYIITAAVGSYANKEKLRYLSFTREVVDVPDVTKMSTVLGQIVQSQCTFGGDCGHFDIAFIIDNSDSMSSVSSTYMDQVKQFITKLMEHFKLESFFGSQVAVVSFSDSAKIEFHFNEANTKEKLKELISSMKQLEGRSDLTSAIKLTEEKIFNSDILRDRTVPNIVVILTDGHINKGVDELEEAAKELREKATVITLGLSQFADKETLRYISDHYIHVNYVLSQNVIDEVKGKICEKATH